MDEIRDGVDVTSVRSLAHANSPPQMLLTSAAVLCRNAAFQIEALPHVVERISEFLDYAVQPYWTIPRASERGDLKLLHRLAAREPLDIDPHYKMFLFSTALVNAVTLDRLDIVQWLCGAYCPSGFASNGMEEASKLGRVDILEWLAENHENILWSSIFPEIAAQNGHVDVLEWLRLQSRFVLVYGNGFCRKEWAFARRGVASKPPKGRLFETCDG